MPVSMVCETTATVNAALHDSLATNCIVPAVSETANSSLLSTAVDNNDLERIENKLSASTKRVLQSKIEFEEVNSYSHKLVETIKSKCIPLNSKSTIFNGFGMGNGTNLPAVPYTNGINGHPNSANTAGLEESENTNTLHVHTNGHFLSDPDTDSGRTATINSGNECISGFSGYLNTNDGNNNNGNGIGRKQNTELPSPKIVLFPREKVRLGWRGLNRKWKPGAGLLNVGNTCYLNATLQALFHVPAMANWLCTDALEHMENCDESESSCIICAVAKTLQASQGSQPAIRPYSVCSRMKYICKTLVIGRQEDAHEFLRYLVEGMERCFLQSIPNHKQLDQFSKETTPINQILGGYLKSAVRCLACNHVSVTFQHFQDLLLDIRKGDTVEQALDIYFSRERLEDMGYKCESCRKKVSATKQFSLERAPYVLCIQLKRFSMSGAKINKQVQIKTRLDLTKYAIRKPTEPLTYRLVSLITHLGSSPNCGHYTAIGLTQTGTYYSFDDSSVYPCGYQNICSTNAYIIFYELDLTLGKQEAPSTVITNGGTNNNSTKENFQNTNSSRSPNPTSKITNPISFPGYSKPLPLTVCNSSNNSCNGFSQLNNKPKAIINFIKNPELMKMNYYTNGSVSPTHPKGHTSYNNINYQNGLMNGSLRFQDLAQIDTPAVTSRNRENNGPSSSTSENSFSDSEDELNSIQKSNRNISTLPDMPKLFDCSSTPGINDVPKTPTPISNLSDGTLKIIESYFSDSGDETEIDLNDKKHNSRSPLPKPDIKADDNQQTISPAPDTEISNETKNVNSEKKGILNKILQNNLSSGNDMVNGENCIKPISCSPPPSNISSDLTESANSARFSPNLICNEKTQPQIGEKDSIDEIFNKLKKNFNNGSGPKQVNGEDSKSFTDGKCKRPKRSQSTPPSTGLVETKTGVWQVTSLKETSNDDSVICAKKNPNNPFATKPISCDFTAKRPKLESEVKGKTPVNGCSSDVSKSNIVSELLKQSHRGYGTSVPTWSGTQNKIESESLSLSSYNGGDLLHQADSSISLNNHSIIDYNIEQLTDLPQLEKQPESNILKLNKQSNADEEVNCCPKDDMMIVEDEQIDKTSQMATSSCMSSPYLTLLTSDSTATTAAIPNTFQDSKTSNEITTTSPNTTALSSPPSLRINAEQAVNLSLSDSKVLDSRKSNEDLSIGIEENNNVP